MKNYKIILALFLSIIISSCSTPDYPSDPSSIQPEASQNRWWKWISEKPVDSRPFAYKGIIFAYSEKGILYAMDGISGNELWSFDFDNEDYSFNDPLFYEDTVFMLLSSGTCYALDIYDGSVLWKLQQNDIPEEDVLNYVEYHGEREIKAKKLKEYKSVKMPTDSTFLYGNIHDHTLFFCFSAKAIEIDSSGEPNFKIKDYITAINPGNGDILWEFILPVQAYRNRIVKSSQLFYNDPFGPRADPSPKAYFRQYGRRLSACYDNLVFFNIPTDMEVEKCHYYMGRRYFTGSIRKLFALDKKTGRLVWEKTGEIIFEFNPHVNNGILYCLEVIDLCKIEPVYLSGLDARTGQILWEYRIKNIKELTEELTDYYERKTGYVGTFYYNRYIGRFDIFFPSNNNGLLFLYCCIESLDPPIPPFSANYIIAINALTGEIIWDKFFENSTAVNSLIDDNIYLTQRQKQPLSDLLHNIDLIITNSKTGEEIRRIELNTVHKDYFIYFLIKHENMLYLYLRDSYKLNSGTPYIYIIDIPSCKVEGIIKAGSSFHEQANDIIFANDMIYISSSDSGNCYIYALEESTIGRDISPGTSDMK